MVIFQGDVYFTYGGRKMSEKKKVLITGITGQDAGYLAKLLLEKGYKVYGTFRRLSTPNFWRIKDMELLTN